MRLAGLHGSIGGSGGPVAGAERQVGADRRGGRREVEDVVTETEDVPGYVGREGGDVFTAYRMALGGQLIEHDRQLGGDVEDHTVGEQLVELG